MPQQPPTPISAVFITLNAAQDLEQAIQSVGFCDECLVVDSGSTDGTVELASQLGARVLHCEWRGFGPQKQWAVEQAKHNWVLCIDADERLSTELQNNIKNLWQNGQAPAANTWGFKLPRRNAFLGRLLRHGEGYPDWCLRLFNRNYARWSADTVHEKVMALDNTINSNTLTEKPCPNPIEKLQGDLLHHSADTLEHYISKQNHYTTLQAQKMAASGQCPSAMRMVLAPLMRFIKFYIFRLGFFDGWQGLVHIGVGCFFTLVKYAKTREQVKTKAQQKLN